MSKDEQNWILGVVLIAALVGGVLYLHNLFEIMSVEPPPQHAAEIARTRLTEAALQTSRPQETAKLYFPSFELGALIEERRPIAWAATDADRIRQVVLALVEGSHQGLARALPPVAAIRGVFVTPDGAAYLDFAEESFADSKLGIASESLVLDAIVNSITVNVPRVQRVRILVQGQNVDSLDGHVDLGEFLLPDLTRVAAAP
jgi:hypothetical protein